jgi:hypothetical protein
MLVEASIDHLFDTHVSKATAMVDKPTEKLIEHALASDLAKKNAKAAIKTGLYNEIDVLMDFEIKFMQHFKEALADAVARLMAEKSRSNLLEQLTEV